MIARENPNPNSDVDWTLLFICWVLASGSSLGSVFFSHVMEFAPCELCWYQRIAMFPLVLLFAVGLFPFDKSVLKFAIPLVGLGWVLAVYHNLLYSGMINKEMQPCAKGVSCTEKYIDLLGFITIPMLTLASFSIIMLLLLIIFRRTAK